MIIADQWNDLLVRFIGGVVSDPMTTVFFVRIQSHLRFVQPVGEFFFDGPEDGKRQPKENECYLLTQLNQRNNPLDYSSKPRLPFSGDTMSRL